MDRERALRIPCPAIAEACLSAEGVVVEKAVVPGVGHEGLKVIPVVEDFLARRTRSERWGRAS
jgi:hypothetical protein